MKLIKRLLQHTPLLLIGVAVLVALAAAFHLVPKIAAGGGVLMGTTFLAGAFDTRRQDGEVVAVPVTAAKTVYQGAMVVWDGAGNVEPLVGNAASQPANFAGVARTGAPGGGDPTQADPLAASGQVLVERRGIFYYETADASPQLGEVVYGITDNWVSATAGATSIKVGTIVEIPGDGTVGVQITGAVV